MTTLFVNAAYRDGSRTLQLAHYYLEGLDGDIVTVDLGATPVAPINLDELRLYSEAVAAHDTSDAFFDTAKQFARADQIVIAAPYWNNSIPAVLHAYLERVCSQGATFDIEPDGTYVGLCRARKLVFITTAGGSIPEDNHAFGYVASLARDFWYIPEVVCYQAEGLDIIGCDIEAELQRVREQMRVDRLQSIQ